MGTGYTRQSSADIQTGQDITAAPLNAEFNQLQSAFDSSTGHSHDGTSGEGPLIVLTTSISGILPVAHGGIAAIHKIDGTTAPTVNEDSGDGYGAGSFWIDVTNDIAYVCVDPTATAAVWYRISYPSTIAAIGALTPTDGNIIVGNGSTWVAESGATARASLGLTIGTNVQAWDAQLDDIAALAVTDGNIIVGNGTNWVAESGATARTSLGLTIGTNVQAWGAVLDDLNTLGAVASDGQFIVGTAAGVFAYESGATARASLGLTIGTDVQAYDAELAAIAGLTSAADRLPYFTGSGTASLATFTSFGRSLVDDADAATARSTLGLVIGTNVQAYSANLAAIAALAVTDSNIIVGNGTTWVAESGATARTSLGLTIGTDVQAYDVDTLKADTADQLAAGFDATAVSVGTKSSGTYTPAAQSDGSNFLYGINGGAHIIAPPTNNCSIVLHYTNNATAGAITTSGFTLVDGDSYDTTDTYEFILYITKVNDVSHLTIKALQ